MNISMNEPIAVKESKLEVSINSHGFSISDGSRHFNYVDWTSEQVVNSGFTQFSAMPNATIATGTQVITGTYIPSITPGAQGYFTVKDITSLQTDPKSRMLDHQPEHSTQTKGSIPFDAKKELVNEPRSHPKKILMNPKPEMDDDYMIFDTYRNLIENLGKGGRAKPMEMPRAKPATLDWYFDAKKTTDTQNTLVQDVMTALQVDRVYQLFQNAKSLARNYAHSAVYQKQPMHVTINLTA